MSELVAWLRAQLDEDERLARAATRSGGGGEDDDGVWSPAEAGPWGEARVEGIGITIYDEGGHTPEQAGHIARHDPARVLREVEAKRRIMEIHHGVEGFWPGSPCNGCGYAGDCEDPVTEDVNDCPELRALAAVYADRSCR